MSHTRNRLHETLIKLFQSHPWHGVSTDVAGTTDLVNAYIEIVPTDTVKYELDKPSGLLRLDRPQHYSSQCPALYGLIPQTYCGRRIGDRCSKRTRTAGIQGDGDPMDICVLTEKPIAHGNFLAHVRPIGGLRMIDSQQADDKIIAVLESDVAYADFHDIGDCPQGLIDRLKHYFLSYKQMPEETSRRVSIAAVYDRTEALEVIALSVADYQEHFGSQGALTAELQKLLRAAVL